MSSPSIRVRNLAEASRSMVSRTLGVPGAFELDLVLPRARLIHESEGGVEIGLDLFHLDPGIPLVVGILERSSEGEVVT